MTEKYHYASHRCAHVGPISGVEVEPDGNVCGDIAYAGPATHNALAVVYRTMCKHKLRRYAAVTLHEPATVGYGATKEIAIDAALGRMTQARGN